MAKVLKTPREFPYPYKRTSRGIQIDSSVLIMMSWGLGIEGAAKELGMSPKKFKERLIDKMITQQDRPITRDTHLLVAQYLKRGYSPEAIAKELNRPLAVVQKIVEYQKQNPDKDFSGYKITIEDIAYGSSSVISKACSLGWKQNAV